MDNKIQFKDLEDKVVFITGAAKGMGLAMAHAFANQGCRLALLDIDASALEAAKRSIGLSNQRCITLEASVTDAAGIKSATDKVSTHFGELNVLIANAGISMNQPTQNISPEQWLNAVNINLNGVFFCAQASASQMIKQGHGVIICMGSIYGVATAPNRAAYCATKSAVVALSKSLAAEWAPHGLRVNALCPGYVQTPFLSDLMQRGVLSQEALESRIPLGHLATPEQVAEVALYMASNASRYMTGHAMVVDGGFVADIYKASSLE